MEEGREPAAARKNSGVSWWKTKPPPRLLRRRCIFNARKSPQHLGAGDGRVVPTRARRGGGPHGGGSGKLHGEDDDQASNPVGRHHIVTTSEGNHGGESPSVPRLNQRDDGTPVASLPGKERFRSPWG